jgi:tetratricopeptide (TPR) repeat protein
MIIRLYHSCLFRILTAIVLLAAIALSGRFEGAPSENPKNNLREKLRESISRSSDKVGATLSAASIYLRLGHFSDCERAIDGLLKEDEKASGRKLKPIEKAYALILMAECVFEQGDSVRAVDLADIALSVDPYNANTQNGVAYIYAQAGVKLEKALTLAMKALENHSDSPAITDTVGWIYFKMGKYLAAITYLTRAVNLSPNEVVMRNHLGQAYLRVGNPKRASVEFRKALHLKPTMKESRTIREYLNCCR